MNQISELMKDFLKGEELEVFNNKMEGFANLHDDEEVVAVLNPVGMENLYIQTCPTGAVLAFGNWREEYDADETGIEDLKQDVMDILANRKYVWSVVSCKMLMVGLVGAEDIRYLDNSNLMGMDYMAASSFLDGIARAQGQQDFLFWDPEISNPQPRYFLS